MVDLSAADRKGAPLNDVSWQRIEALGLVTHWLHQ